MVISGSVAKYGKGGGNFLVFAHSLFLYVQVRNMNFLRKRWVAKSDAWGTKLPPGYVPVCYGLRCENVMLLST